jgi:hypothetical protein
MQLIGMEKRKMSGALVFVWDMNEQWRSNSSQQRCPYINYFTLVRILHFVAFKPSLIPTHPLMGPS